MTVLVFIVVIILILLLAIKSGKQRTPKQMDQQKQTDELITVILPTINNDN